MAKMIALFVLSVGLTFVGASAPATSPAKPAPRPARHDLLVSPQWLANHLEDPHLAILHVGFDCERTGGALRSTYLDGHIPGALPVGWCEIVRTRQGILNELPPAEDLVALVRALGLTERSRIVLYDTGSGIEAARAFFTLDYLGLGDHAALLDGQWALWKGLDLPMERMPRDVEPSTFVPRLHPEVMVNLQQMQDFAFVGRLLPTTVSVIDARQEAEYTGFKAGAGIRRPGHIPGAVNVCWNTVLMSETEPLFRSEDQLQLLLEDAEATAGKDMVLYCRTGTEACLLYFVAKYLGFAPRLYDGSYFEWTGSQENPIQGTWASR